MSKQKHLTKKQLAVIDDLFETDLQESEILKKHQVSRLLYNRWLAEKIFADEIDRRIAAVYKRNAACIASNATKAINKLLSMAGADPGELTRKACLNIIELQNQASENKLSSPQPQSESTPCLSDEAAGRILAALAEDR